MKYYTVVLRIEDAPVTTCYSNPNAFLTDNSRVVILGDYPLGGQSAMRNCPLTNACELLITLDKALAETRAKEFGDHASRTSSMSYHVVEFEV